MFAKLNELARVRVLVMGAPEEESEACVAEDREDGFTRGVVGMWNVKRAAVVRDASSARGANEERILVGGLEGW